MRGDLPEIASPAACAIVDKAWTRMVNATMFRFMVGVTTWNTLYEWLDAIRAIASEARCSITLEEYGEYDWRASGHLYHAARQAERRVSLVRADPVPCPECDGAGGYGGWTEDGWYGEPCSLCDGYKWIPRCQAHMHLIALFLDRVFADARPFEITPIDAL